MKDWLLKDEKKNKVGRPKLADDMVVKKAVILISFCLILCFILGFSFVCSMKNTNPLNYAYSLTIEKIVGTLENKNGFIVKERYNNENNYVMEIKSSSILDSYSGNYKYVLYKLDGSNWKEVETKEYPAKTKSFKIKVDALENQNQTYKISLYVLNASKINVSFAPSRWKFSDSSKQNEKHAYKVFTVKGYYSPIALKEINEANDKKDVIRVSTDKKDPRFFTLSVPDFKYRALVKYTDETGKEITLSDDEDCFGNKTYKIPNVSKSTNVTFTVWAYEASKNKLESMKLSGWNLSKDDSGIYYLNKSYTLKPEKGYKN